MNNQIDYVVKFPIYGYRGMGYESQNFITKSFSEECFARKYAKHVNKAFEINEALRLQKIPYATDMQNIFMDYMEENVSFSIKGPAQIFKRETIVTKI